VGPEGRTIPTRNRRLRKEKTRLGLGKKNGTKRRRGRQFEEGMTEFVEFINYIHFGREVLREILVSTAFAKGERSGGKGKS